MEAVSEPMSSIIKPVIDMPGSCLSKRVFVTIDDDLAIIGVMTLHDPRYAEAA
jgi:hypothetical protein